MSTPPYIYVAELCRLFSRSRFTWYRVLSTLSREEIATINLVPDGRGTRLNRDAAIAAMERFIATRTPRSRNLGTYATKGHQRARPAEATRRRLPR